jgi:hypothetical protein
MPVSTTNAPSKTLTACRVNRRLAVRYPSGVATADGVAGLHGVMFKNVRVYDISQGGIALVLNRPLKQGENFFIQVTNNILDFSYDLDAEVRHVRPFGPGRWIVGFEFPRELTTAELASLL